MTERAGGGGDASGCLCDDEWAGAWPLAPKTSDGRFIEEEVVVVVVVEEEEEEGAAADNDEDDSLAEAAAAATADVADDASKDDTGGPGGCTSVVRNWPLALLPTAEDWDTRSRGEDGGLM